MTNSQDLPSKEQSQFRQVVRFYEQKLYKKGLKAADIILKKYPNNGETLSVKGLILNVMDRRDEAFDHVRQGLRNNVRSHMCWHSYGLLYRCERDYAEAVKCYRNALKFDKENLQILRDLSMICLHRRDMEAFRETRSQILHLRANNRMHWIAYALSEHLCGSYEMAVSVLTSFEEQFLLGQQGEGGSYEEGYEAAEAYMYKASILEEWGKYEEALTYLSLRELKINDRIGFLEMKGRLLVYLKKTTEASEVFLELLSGNTDNEGYAMCYVLCEDFMEGIFDHKENLNSSHEAMLQLIPPSLSPYGRPAIGWLGPSVDSLTVEKYKNEYSKKNEETIKIWQRLGLIPKPSNRITKIKQKEKISKKISSYPLENAVKRKICQKFDELREKYDPKSDTLSRLPLFFCEEDEFMTRLDKFARPRIRKSAPSLFTALKSLPRKEKIEELLSFYLTNLRKNPSSFGTLPGQEKDETIEIPSSFVFCCMLYAQQMDLMGHHKLALQTIDEAIAHTPTFLELFMVKAKIYKHLGDLDLACSTMEKGRELDLADRYINSKNTKYLLRKLEPEQAKTTISMFSREANNAEAAPSLQDLQCMWYEVEAGKSWYKKGEDRMALKMCHDVMMHFDDIREDQFDFHAYCMRKLTLRPYMSFLRMEDRLYCHWYFRKAAKITVKIQLRRYDKSLEAETADKSQENEDAKAQLGLDKKKLKRLKKQQQAEQTKQNNGANGGGGGRGGGGKKDPDPLGFQLYDKDIIEECKITVSKLLENCSMDVNTWIAAAALGVRSGKLLLVAQSLSHLWVLLDRDIFHRKMLPSLVECCKKISIDGSSELIKEVVLKVLGGIVDSEIKCDEDIRRVGRMLLEKACQRLNEPNSNLSLVLTFAQSKIAFNEPLNISNYLKVNEDTNVQECRKMLKFLNKNCKEETEQFRAQSRHRFPDMVDFIQK
eukprot:GHVL01043695.1.p1 GENE.GHVL01043695.1~~GHVL01043695.1.p1  ORF type:complete len:941 (+),score=191.34 GHVL01043695.1:277-3099(+)